MLAWRAAQALRRGFPQVRRRGEPKQRKPAVMTPRACSSTYWRLPVKSPAPRKRTSAGPQARTSVKASLLVDVETHARWSAAAALRGMDRNAFAVEALKEALRGIIVVDRRKSSDRSAYTDRLVLEDELKDPAENEAA